MKILLTGAFGNIGEPTLRILLNQDHEITCFDIKTKKNVKKAKKLLKLGDFNVFWGDITNIEDVNKAVSDNECVIHLAAIIPPPSEKNAELTKRINVDGTENIINAIKNSESQPRLIFASSITVHGACPANAPLRKTSDGINPTDNYTRSKVECEKMINNSGIKWTIFRLSAAPSFDINLEASKVLFDIPLEQPIEYVAAKDVAQALVNVISQEADQKIFFIGGGKKCQMTYRDFVKGTLKAYGIGFPNDVAFRVPQDDDDWYYTAWLDTEDSQTLLNYQQTTFDDVLANLKEEAGFKRHFFKLLNPIIKWYLEKNSPYKEENLKNFSD